MVEGAPVNRRIWRRRLIFIVVVAAAAAGSYFWGRHVEPPPVELDAARVALLTGATERPERLGGAEPYWRIRRGDETLYAAESSLLAPDVAGYGGPFDLLVVVDEAGDYERVVVVRHNETPSYVEDVASFLASFVGLSPAEPLEPGRDVDVITRATVTSDAFAAATRITGREILRRAHGREMATDGEGGGAWDWPWALAAAAFLAAAVWLSRHPREPLRIVVALAAVGALGFWAGRFISVSDMGRMVLWEFPPFGPRLSLYVLLGGAALTARLWGNVYCGWVCPFGALAELLYKIPVKKLRVPAAFARRLSSVRFILMCVVVGAIIASRELGAAAYEPFDDLFAYGAAGVSLVFLVAVLAASVFHYRFFCRYLCAAGAVLGEVAAVGRAGAVPACGESDECRAACPTGALISRRGDVARELCVECGRCRVARGRAAPEKE
jgi:ferredoxin